MHFKICKPGTCGPMKLSSKRMYNERANNQTLRVYLDLSVRKRKACKMGNLVDLQKIGWVLGRVSRVKGENFGNQDVVGCGKYIRDI
jgi:hypothetical protein